ncbi:MAG TPA: PAS domain-containing sensor histidine kinase, partial [Ottowia sp.]|nr:PAS domain-containing sensor histidine kinase [Ottowia sp.]
MSSSAAAPLDAGIGAALRRLRAGAWRRHLLWGVLSLVVLGLLAILVWLARGHEIEQVQRALERDSADATQVLRERLARNVQDLHGLGSAPGDPAAWAGSAARLLDSHREWLRLQWRDPALALRAEADSPFHAPLPPDGPAAASDLERACAQARAQGEPIYAPS